MRISRYISNVMACSRKRADSLIKTGEVTVNDVIATFSMEVLPKDIVKVKGSPVTMRTNPVYLIFNKQAGITCTAARNVKDNIIDYINYPERIFPVGRLDKDSEGLILLTNDGHLANKLLQEENEQEKEYIVTVNRPLTADFVQGMRSGVKIYNPRKKTYCTTKACPVVQLDEHRFSITLIQGWNRQIRRMCRSFQFTVTQLERVRFKQLTLNGLVRGSWRHLTEFEVEQLRRK